MLVIREHGVQTKSGCEVTTICPRKKIENQQLLIGGDDAALPIGHPGKTAAFKLPLNNLYYRFFVATLDKTTHLGLHCAGSKGVVLFTSRNAGVSRGRRRQVFSPALEGPSFYPVRTVLRGIRGIP